MQRRVITFTIAVLTSICAWAGRYYTPAEVPNVHVADRTQYVSNPDGILSLSAVDSLNAMLGTVWSRTSAEPVVVAIADMAPEYDVNSFATELFEIWEIGKKDKDNGLLILLVTERRKMAIRTGYGLEGLLPDGVCGRIRDRAISYFKTGDYAAGLETAVAMSSEILLRPEARDEILSKYANDARGSKSGDDTDPIMFMVYAGLAGLGIMMAWVLYVMLSSRRRTERERYRLLNNIKPVALFVTFIGLGIPVPAYLLCVWLMKRIRDHKRNCPNCGGQMHKLDEVHDNDYLTPAQDMEERLNSIDYDVWLCDTCGEKDVIPYINRQSSYTVCPRCGARTMALAGNRIISQPTASREGRGEKLYSCRNCQSSVSKPYTIAKLATPVVIIPGGGGGRGFGGGGFGGGSFGGGMTGGGGASGGW